MSQVAVMVQRLGSPDDIIVPTSSQLANTKLITAQAMKNQPVITIPDEFTSEIIAEYGIKGKEWVETIPIKLHAFCELWNLTVDGELAHGHLGLVFPVKRDHEVCVLKIAWPGSVTDQEVVALKAWDGRGAVKLLNSQLDAGVLLLERLDSNHTLEDVELKEAMTIAGNLLRRLAVPAPQELPDFTDHADKILINIEERWRSLNEPFAEEYIKIAQKLIESLTPGVANLIVDWDLHYGNVLAGEREPWLAIDPKVLKGDLEFGVFPLILRRLSEQSDTLDIEGRFSIINGAADLNIERSLGWTFVRTIDYWLWALSVGYTEDPKECKKIIEWLMMNKRML